MKVLMVGLGSIGQRHLRNIRRLYGDDVRILAYRVRGLKHTFSDTMQIRENIDLEQEYSITSFETLHAALEEKPEVAFITNITSAHMSCAIEAARAGCDLFLEKPVSNNMHGIEILGDLISKNNLVAFVGFQNRYHPCIKKLKEVLDSKVLGKIISVEVTMGERLITMHSYEDYRDTYMARNDMGGGVVLNQQIHELDYIQFLFGKPVSVYSVNGINSGLEVDVEDYCSSIYIANYDGREVPIYAHADFVQYPPSRNCKVIGEYGVAFIDLLTPYIKMVVNGETRLFEKIDEFNRNDLFIEELKDFFDDVKKRNQSKIPFADGVISLQMAIAAKLSAAERRVVYLDELKTEED